MDPISIVITALISGLTAGVSDTAKSYVKDSYESLKQALVKHLKGKTKAINAIGKLENSPKSKQAKDNLDSELRHRKVEIDKNLFELAFQVLRLTDPEGAKSGKYSITIENSEGVIVGDNAKVTMNFQEHKKR